MNPIIPIISVMDYYGRNIDGAPKSIDNRNYFVKKWESFKGSLESMVFGYEDDEGYRNMRKDRKAVRIKPEGEYSRHFPDEMLEHNLGWEECNVLGEERTLTTELKQKKDVEKLESELESRLPNFDGFIIIQKGISSGDWWKIKNYRPFEIVVKAINYRTEI